MAASHFRSDRWRLMVVGASVVLAAVVLPSRAGATPSYQGGASAGWAYQEGDVLIANPGEWTSTTSITYTYAWFNENSLALGTGPTYTVAGKDVGHQIYAAITATDGVAPSLDRKHANDGADALPAAGEPRAAHRTRRTA